MRGGQASAGNIATLTPTLSRQGRERGIPEQFLNQEGDGDMPIYEFSCLSCKKPFQTYTPTMAWKGVRCPKCGSLEIQKQLSRFAVISGESGVGEDFGSDVDGGECSGDPDHCPRCDTD